MAEEATTDADDDHIGAATDKSIGICKGDSSETWFVGYGKMWTAVYALLCGSTGH